jgi:3-deoxy-D-manno-octulosonic-acid transferase
MFVQSFYFVSHYFLELNMMILKKKNQETYNSRLRERYGDDPSTHPDFDPDLWMEVRSSGGPEKNRVYNLSNTTAENLWSARSVSTVWSSPSVSSIQSEEFVALKQQYERLSTNYDQLRQMVMDIRSRMGDDTCAAPFWTYGPGNNQPPPPPPPAPPLF